MKKNLINKRNIVIACILVLFVVAVIVNISTNNKKEDVNKNNATGSFEDAQAVISNVDYYTAFRDNRDSVREKEVAYLESILAAEDADEEMRNEAYEQKLNIVAYMESELLIESAIKAKGFADAAVTFHKGAVNVVVSADELEDKQVAQILDIVMRETSEPAENIKISVQK